MKDIIREAIGLIVTSYFGAVFLILVGFGLIYFTIKYPQKDPGSPLQGDIQGWVGGIMLIFAGFLIIIQKIMY